MRVLDPTPACPASVVARHSLGSFRDAASIEDFGADVDVLTGESAACAYVVLTCICSLTRHRQCLHIL